MRLYASAKSVNTNTVMLGEQGLEPLRLFPRRLNLHTKNEVGREMGCIESGTRPMQTNYSKKENFMNASRKVQTTATM